MWRPEDEEDCRYRLIGANNFTSSQVNQATDLMIADEEQIRFQTNDVIGISVQSTTNMSPSVRQRSNFNPEGIIFDQERTSYQEGDCVNLTTSKTTRGVPAITARIG